MRASFTQGFSHFLRRRRARRHFERRPLLDTLAAQPAARSADAAGWGRELLAASLAEPAQALQRLQSQADGLDAAEAARRLARDGPNEVQHEAPLPGWLRLWRCWLNPFNLLLTALALLSFFSADAKATVVIGFMVALSTGIRFVQEGRSHRAAEGLRALVTNTAAVIRRGNPPALPPARTQELPVHDLVAGDLVALSAGDMVPADCRLLSARDLFVAQAAMTGESLPVEKLAAAAASGTVALEQRNLVFMGTNVVSGTAEALVLATGARSYFGLLAAHAGALETAPNAFQAGVNSVSWLLIRFAAVMVPIVFFINGFTKGDWLQAFLFSLSVAVGLTPEMLPMIVTTTLAKGAVRLARLKVVVKRLDAIQNFGAMDVLCTDKTGTLTQDRVALARHADPCGQDSTEVLGLAFLNSHYQTGLKNLLDHAVLADVDPATERRLAEAYRKVDELPFDFERRRMSVVVAAMVDGREQRHELICKGAVEEVLAACTRARVARPAGGDASQQPLSLPLDAALRARTGAVTAGLSAEGLRVVAVAVKLLPPEQARYSVADESGLTLVGYIAFLDPPKESAAPALTRLAAHGIAVKVLTGDNEQVTRQVCRQVGVPVDAVLLGAEVEALSDAELQAAADSHRVFAKLTPLHKERIVRALRERGHVVGFMGDGINDAPALRAADIGISVDSAVDIAKEAADIILLEKSLLVLDAGVVEGRSTFCNMLKYIRMTASGNFGNVLSVLVASAFLPFLPMLPLQLLVQNLLYDIAQTGIPFDKVDAELVARPLRWNPADIGRFMLFFGPISSLFDILTFGLMWWVFDANSLARQTLFQSGWFVVGLLTQTLVVHMVRTPRLPFVQSHAAAPLMAMTAAIVAVGLWLPNGPLAAYFSLQALPPSYYGWLLAIVLGYCTLTTWMKRVYIRRYGWQ
ncbi:magnesium-translocating P-type ATPase [Rubrivivax gelatinosus]|uniref:Magnesium-transporting ATPase, P-type 1 n=1 Tax=Rubrivivax gelatinosus TaxID=28068 RepID=A0ABS1DRM8_RUBGE|nr:magnesium-translocating P-type ATPase [Rubrivivax gelatinosus]MBK1712659.1 magnesium-translocating P-type ATPase [Rubrivivax gelatinosus]